MKIEGANFLNYDAQHLQIVRRETAQSVKPNLFKGLDDSVAQALLLTDLVDLSPEAKELLDKLKRQMEGKSSRTSSSRKGKEEDLRELIYNLRQLQELVHGKPSQEEGEAEATGEKGEKPGPGAPHQGVIQLGHPLRGGRKTGGEGSSAVRDLVGRMTVHAPSSQARSQVESELAVLGETMVRTVGKFGVRIIVLEPQVPLTRLKIAGVSVIAPGERTFDGRDWAGVRGLYDESRRIIVLGQEVLGHPEHSAARHEFAHAFDHTFTVNHQRRQPLSVQLWNLFAAQRKGLVSPYAGTNPREYFAETVETFFKPRGRDIVLEKDPQMHQYLETLFAS